MTIQEQVNADLRSAMLSRNEFQKSILRFVIGEFNREGKQLEDAVAVKTIKKTIENAKIVNNLEEALFLEKYLPSQLSDLELTNLIDNIVKSNSYSVKDMGKIMSFLKENYAGKYDGKKASEVIKTILSN